jgi:hypothetical protein
MSLHRAGYLFVAGIGFTSVGIFGGLHDLQHQQRKELSQQFRQQRDLLYILKIKEFKS